MSVNSQGKMEVLKNHAALEGRWGNIPEENVPMGPPSGPVNYKGKTYLPNASEWATKQRTLEEHASSERSRSPMTLSNSNLENIERNRRSYNRYRERIGLSPRRNRTPSRERRRRTYRRSPRRRYGVGKRYNPAPRFSVRRRSQSPKRRHSPSPKPRRSAKPRQRPSPRRRQSPGPRRSARHSPRRTVNEFGRNITYSYRPRNESPLRYTIGPEGERVNEFGRNVSRKYRSRRPSRSISPLRYTVAPNGKTVNEFGRNVSRRRKF
jgi:hypothetical protein